MTQQQQIDLLNSIIPEIEHSKSPEKAMLKCARDHNLSPAQLQKLAQVFNAAKTLVGLEKSSSRGKSHSLVNVPELVKSYTTWNPNQTVGVDSAPVHRKVNRLVKYASEDLDGWADVLTEGGQTQDGHVKSASLEVLDSMFEAGPGGFNGYAEIDMSPRLSREGLYDISFNDSEFARKRNRKVLDKVASLASSGLEQLQQIRFDASYDCNLSMDAMMRKFAALGHDAWYEAAEDICDAYGQEGMDLVRSCEQRAWSLGFRPQPFSLDKRAFVRNLVVDRHSVFPEVEDLLALGSIYKQATGALEAAGLLEKDAATITRGNGDWVVTPESGGQKEVKRQENVNPVVEPDDDPPLSLPRRSKEDMDDFRRRVRLSDIYARRPIEIPKQPEYIPHREIQQAEPTVVFNDESAPQGKKVDVAAAGGEALGALLEGMKSPWLRNERFTLGNIYGWGRKTLEASRPRVNKAQQTVDALTNKGKADAVLQQLILSDPIIQEADAGTVNDLFRTIEAMNPTFAYDVNRMRPVLREALQYDSIPVHIMKELAELRKLELGNEMQERRNEQETYRI